MYSSAASNSDRGINRRNILSQLAKEFVGRCSPKNLLANPIMVMMLVGAVLSAFALLERIALPTGFNAQIVLLLWSILLIAILAEAFVGARWKTGNDVNELNSSTVKVRRLNNGVEQFVSPGSLRESDLVICETGEVIPADGIVVQGTAIVDESAINGQSPPVVRESGGDQNNVCGKTTVLGGRIVIRLTSASGMTVHDWKISSAEKIKYRHTKDEKLMAVPLWFLIVGLSVIVISVPFFAQYGSHDPKGLTHLWLNFPAMIAIWICTFPLAIAELLNIAGLSAVGRLLRRKIIPSHIGAIESAGEINVLMLDERDVLSFDRQVTKGRVLGFGNMNGDISEIEDDGPTSAFPSDKFQKMGIKTVISSEEGKLSSAVLAVEAGIDDVVMSPEPEDKIARIHSERNSGHVVAVVGDQGINGLAMSHADVGFIVNGSPEKSVGSGNTVELNGRPSRLIEVVETGKRLINIQKMVTRFGIASTISLSLIVLFPLIAMSYGFDKTSGIFSALNFLNLASPQSVILDILIFNLLVLILFVPVVLKAVDGRNLGTNILSRFNSMAYGIVGFAAPIVVVKLVDMTISVLR